MLSEKLKEIGMSRRQLARESRVSYRTVIRIISGDRIGSLDTWMRFSRAMGCDISEIINMEGNVCYDKLEKGD